MSGWRLAISVFVPACAALFFMKLIADAVASTTAELKLVKLARQKAWERRNEHAAPRNQEAQPSS